MSSTPAKKRVSLDAKAKQRRDALAEPTPFELYGVEFTLPSIKTLPFDVQERVGRNDAAMFRLVLGAEKVQEMIDAGMTVSDSELIFEEWQAFSGVEPGESQASPTS